MKSITKLFRVGYGPSSSHTVAPSIAARSFKKKIASLKGDRIEATLHGSLALTGEGHGTKKAIASAFAPLSTTFRYDFSEGGFPNSFELSLFSGKDGVLRCHYQSLGGGELYSEDDPSVNEEEVYPFSSLEEIKSFMNKNGIATIKDFCLRYEGEEVTTRLEKILVTMFSSIENGLRERGLLPSDDNPRLRWERCAYAIYDKSLQIQDEQAKRTLKLTSYAYAVAESNASMEEVVTAPTCGASGVLAAVLYYAYKDEGIPFSKIVDSLFVAGLFGNIVKQNASIAGAIGGCQAEIGTATSMSAAALSFLHDLSFHQIEYAAECAMEHFLGLSCDSVDGYVIIPCIERNGVGALRAYSSFLYAKFIEPIRANQVNFDNVVKAMKLTGESLSSDIKETANGGLAKVLKKE